MDIDPLDLARALIARPSVTPQDAGAMAVLRRALEGLGFACRAMPFGEVQNLYARRGTAGPNLCFAGHTDVVPPGDEAAWSGPPFEPRIVDGRLHGRGAADMKGGIAAWVAAISRVVRDGPPPGSLSLLITGDEEGMAVDGTRRVVEALQDEDETIDHCVLGEPTSAATVGDQVKVGRRGSLNCWITAEGRQGHVAYPQRAANPIPALLSFLGAVSGRSLDEGYPEFPPSNLEIVTVDVGNLATNVIPARATARLNIRFNPNHTGETLSEWLQAERAAHEPMTGGVSLSLTIVVSGEAFLTPAGRFLEVVSEAVRQVTGAAPLPSTSGGTSDARFIHRLCPTVELGLVGDTMHMVDENVPVADIERLTEIYARLIRSYFDAFA